MRTYQDLNVRFENLRRELESKKIVLVPLKDVEDFYYYSSVLCGTPVNGGVLYIDNGTTSQYLYL